MSDVPSNLIPTRITQLPIAPVADENSLMMIVYQGNNYQIRVGDLLSVAGVPTSRQVIAGTGLTGGGQLTDNVTLSVAVGGIGNTELAATGVSAGTYGDAGSIPVFTVDAKGRIQAATTIPVAVSGYVPVTRQVVAGTGLTGGGALNANVTLDANLSDSTPLPTDGLGSAGVSTAISRSDHQHPSVNLQNDAEVDGVLGLNHGGTAKSIVPDNGAIIWCGADGLYVGPVGAAGQILQSTGVGEYIWVNQGTIAAGSADNLTGGNVNTVVYQTATGATGYISAPTEADTFLRWDGSQLVWGALPGGGTVTSVGLSMPSEFSVSNSPVTASGTLTAAWTAQSANKVFAGPATGSSTTPTFRSMVNADLPDSGVTATSYGSSTQVPVISVNSKGVITSASTAAIIGTLNYQGGWNANTNTPTLTSSVGTNGYYYAVTVAGTTNLDGITDWQVGDWAIFNGSVWQKIDQTNTVTSVNGKTGAVVLTYSDLSLGTMSLQNANNVAITGGAIDGTPIGNTTRSSVKATTIDATGATTLPASTTSLVPLHISTGATPTSPTSGDIWTETTGILYQNGGYTHQLNVDTNMSGVLSMPTITITGSGATFDASSVDAFLFSTTTFGGNFKKYTIPAATGLALVDNTTNYLVATYNGGSPAYSVTQNIADINGSDVAGAALLYRQGTEVHYQSVNWGLAPASRTNRRFIQTMRYQRGTGLTLGESTGNVITLSAGNIWYGVTEYAEGAVTSSPSNADFYYHVAGNWTKSVVSTYNITQYDNGTSLQTLGGGKYAVNWVYRYVDGASLPKLAYVLGGGDYSLAQAQASLAPTPPTVLTQMAILVGRIIVVKNGATATAIDSAFTQVFAGSTVTDHNSLSDLQGGTTNEYYHLTSAEYTGTGTGDFVRASSPTLVTPNLGTPSTLVGTNITGTAASLSIGGNAATATTATTATNVAGGAASQIPYQTGSGTTGFIANGTAGQVLCSAGSSVPVWAGIDGGTF